MPPKQTASGARGGAKATKKRQSSATAPQSSNPFESSDDQAVADASQDEEADIVEERTDSEKSIPADLLTRVLHEFFAKDATRISRDANAAVGKYVDVFVREAIARAAVEKKGGFLEVCFLFHAFAMGGWRC